MQIEKSVDGVLGIRNRGHRRRNHGTAMAIGRSNFNHAIPHDKLLDKAKLFSQYRFL